MKSESSLVKNQTRGGHESVRGGGIMPLFTRDDGRFCDTAQRHADGLKKTEPRTRLQSWCDFTAEGVRAAGQWGEVACTGIIGLRNACDTERYAGRMWPKGLHVRWRRSRRRLRGSQDVCGPHSNPGSGAMGGTALE
jgi:hypothetical protein